MNNADARKQLADLAYLRFRAAVDEEGMTETEAFLETIIGLLEAQEEIWGQRKTLQ